MSGIVLSASVRQNLLSLQSTAELLATTQNRLATGKKVNTALDNPTNFFTAQSLDSRAGDINNLLRMLERRVSLLTVLRFALDRPSVYLSIGQENEAPELRSASVVAASYGLGHRTLGTVSVIGPVRMDYPQAIRSVRSAARALSRFVEDVYE